jgi:hypothetical protein
MQYRLSIFIPFLAAIFSVEVLLDVLSSYDPMVAFVERIAVAVMLAAGLTFFWLQFRPPKPPT